jgi:hypothetical protein
MISIVRLLDALEPRHEVKTIQKTFVCRKIRSCVLSVAHDCIEGRLPVCWGLVTGGQYSLGKPLTPTMNLRSRHSAGKGGDPIVWVALTKGECKADVTFVVTGALAPAAGLAIGCLACIPRVSELTLSRLSPVFGALYERGRGKSLLKSDWLAMTFELNA